MARSYTSFGQRRALGRRYSIDPAYLLEADRLLNEYSLAPGREARALQESQFSRGLTFQAQEAALNRAQQAEDRQAQATAGMVGTGANLLATAATIRALTKGAGEPFFGGMFDGTNPKTVSAPSTRMAGTQVPQMPVSVSPARVDNALLAAGETGATGGISAAPAIGSTFSGPNLGAMPATQAPQIPGAAGRTGATGMGATIRGISGPLAIIGAASGVRSRAQLDRPYEERGAAAKFESAPVTGGPPALLEAAGVSSGNAFVKPMTAAAKAEEQLVGEPLDEFFAGNIDKGIGATIGGIIEAPKAFVSTVFGGGK